MYRFFGSPSSSYHWQLWCKIFEIWWDILLVNINAKMKTELLRVPKKDKDLSVREVCSEWKPSAIQAKWKATNETAESETKKTSEIVVSQTLGIDSFSDLIIFWVCFPANIQKLFWHFVVETSSNSSSTKLNSLLKLLIKICKLKIEL